MKNEQFVKWFVMFIIIVKVVYSIAYYGNLVVSNTSDTFSHEYDEIILYWKHVSEFIFILSMSILLIYHFFPDRVSFIQKPILVDKETRLLFVLYGTILIFTADWTVLFDEDSQIIKIINKIK
jgi:hypothetical protein